MKPTSDLVRILQALGDPTRLRLLNLLRGGEICVCYFVEILGEPQPKVSRHLAYLRRAGLVDVRREGKWMHYKLAATPHQPVMDAILDAVADDRQMRRDRLALERACCASRLPGTLQYAPRPQIEP
ncbi:MAG TPA: metalloregulator ArsR/SmtB family transcription factor [Thermoanaerobaculia bacterium]|nr:metalloregulator ArsR/SmtB family transcription factor [Thermoanaerobaculia bacterium]